MRQQSHAPSLPPHPTPLRPYIRINRCRKSGDADLWRSFNIRSLCDIYVLDIISHNIWDAKFTYFGLKLILKTNIEFIVEQNLYKKCREYLEYVFMVCRD
jgi:hypothetical protein